MSVAPNSNYYQNPNMQNNMASKVEIRLSCKNLPSFDTFSKSDPKIFIFLEKKVYSGHDVTSLWERIDSTERIKNNENPIFTKSFYIDYYFEMVQSLRFVVFDMDSDSDEWAKNDYIGYVEKSLGDLISSSKDHVYSCNLLKDVPSGIKIDNSKAKSFSGNSQIFIRIEEVTNSPYSFNFDVTGTNLDKMDTFGKSDPFIIISKFEDNGAVLKVFESPVIKNTLNPSWKNLEISELALNSGDPDKMLLFEVYDWDRNSSNDLIGTFRATTRMLFEQKSFEVINEKKKAKKGKKYTNSGVITFNRIDRIKEYTFIDFPMGGTEIAISFAIDFTGSNGSPSSPSSLHYNKPDYNPNNFYSLNEYQKAISSIGYVLEPYDSNREMEVYGYGAKFFKRSKVEFDCALSGDPNRPSVFGVAGILNCYYQALQSVDLWGPTNFAPIINKIAEKAREGLFPKYANAPLHKYHILTIITDGEITDMENTKKAIANAADAPLSIIIIGVGNSNFDSMEELDGDDVKFSSRDIVQFVPLSKYVDNPSLLSTETLAEIPKQVVDFAKLYKYKPLYA